SLLSLLNFGLGYFLIISPLGNLYFSCVLLFFFNLSVIDSKYSAKYESRLSISIFSSSTSFLNFFYMISILFFNHFFFFLLSLFSDSLYLLLSIKSSLIFSINHSASSSFLIFQSSFSSNIFLPPQ